MPREKTCKPGAPPMEALREEAMSFAGIGFYRYRFDGTVVFMDRGALRIFDLEDRFPDPSELVGREIGSLFVYTGPRHRLRDEVRKRGRVRDFEYSFRTLSGKERCVLHNSYLVRDEGTGEESVEVIMNDITERKRAEKALRESEETLKAILSASPVWIGLARDGKIVWHNGAMRQVMGYREGELDGKDARVLYADEEESGRVRRELDAKVKEKGLGRVDTRWITRDGELIDVHVQASPLDPQDPSRGTIVVASDITYAKRSETALERAKHEKEVILDSLVEHVLYHDPGMKILWANRAACESLGRPRGEVIGEPCYRLWAEREDPCPDCPVIRAMQTGEVCEIEKTTPDGRAWFIRGCPVKGIDGQILGGVEVTLEITERKKVEDALQSSERQYRTTLDSLGDAIHVVDRDLRIVLLNTAFERWIRELGLETDVIGRRVMEVFPFLPDRVVEEYRQVFETGETLVTEEHTEVGERGFVTETRKIPMFENNRVCRVITVVRDITERARAEQERQQLEAQIQHAQKLESLGVLAGGIAHDFNNLLMGIVGNTDLALLSLARSSPAREYLLGVETAAKRAADLCRQMLAYSGRGRFVVQALNLNDLVREMGHLLEVSISKKVSLLYNLSEDLPAIEADPTQLRQVVLNLITNASEAIGDDNGAIRITTGVMECDRGYLAETYLGEGLPEGPYVYLEVVDTGCGMDRRTMERIFDPFFTTKFTGRGLGLAAVIGIVRGHRSALKVSSRVGRGTEFRILFPPTQEIAREAGRDQGDREPWRGTGTVLVVDDEETVRRITGRMLERFGFEVLAAKDGREGVEAFRRHQDQIVAVILDLAMPDLDGREALSEIRAIRTDVPVLLSSGYDEQDIAQEFVGKGVAGFIQKPFQAATLVRKVRRAIGA